MPYLFRENHNKETIIAVAIKICVCVKRSKMLFGNNTYNDQLISRAVTKKNANNNKHIGMFNKVSITNIKRKLNIKLHYNK